MSRRVDLSIVIVNWNGLAVLQSCLTSIYDQPQGVAFEVIVVDNASSDGSVEMIRRKFSHVTIIRNEWNRGFAAANNQAFAIASGRYVLLLNNDTVLSGNAISQSLGYLEANPLVGALGCRIEFPDRSFQTSCYRFNDLLELFMTRLLPLGSVARERLNVGRYWGKQFKSPVDVDVVAGCFLMLRREVLQNVGGLDEDFFMYGEDEEWCSRIKRSGWRIVYYPNVTIIHLHRFSSRRARRALREIECLAPVLVLHKRRGFWVAWCANLLLLGGMMARMPFLLAADLLHVFRGAAGRDLLRSRFVALKAHARGLLRPAWLPLGSGKASTRTSPVGADEIILN